MFYLLTNSYQMNDLKLALGYFGSFPGRLSPFRVMDSILGLVEGQKVQQVYILTPLFI